jgi:hypothetical protein
MGQVFAYVSQQKIITLEKLSMSIFFTKQNNICSAHTKIPSGKMSIPHMEDEEEAIIGSRD